jgi:hypothetical protein
MRRTEPGAGGDAPPPNPNPRGGAQSVAGNGAMLVAIGAPAAGRVTVLLVDPAGGTCTLRHALLSRPGDSSLSDRLGAAVALGPFFILAGAPGYRSPPFASSSSLTIPFSLH